MLRFAYLSVLLVGLAGVLTFDRQLVPTVFGARLTRALLITVPLFLAFDLAGSARGWFFSSPRLNTAIVPPGIPLEEPMLLGFLTILSVTLWQTARRLAR